MMLGFSGESFGNLLVFSTFIMALLIIAISRSAYKRGISIKKHSFSIPLLVIIFSIFIIFPFWLTDLPVKWKLIGTIAGLGATLGNNRGQTTFLGQTSGVS